MNCNQKVLQLFCIIGFFLCGFKQKFFNALKVSGKKDGKSFTSFRGLCEKEDIILGTFPHSIRSSL